MGFPRRDRTEPAVSAGLPATDRCDACGAQAYARAHSATGAVLLFCRHHAEVNAAQLRDQQFTVETFYDALASAASAKGT